MQKTVNQISRYRANVCFEQKLKAKDLRQDLSCSITSKSLYKFCCLHSCRPRDSAGRSPLTPLLQLYVWHDNFLLHACCRALVFKIYIFFLSLRPYKLILRYECSVHLPSFFRWAPAALNRFSQFIPFLSEEERRKIVNSHKPARVSS